MKKAVVVLFLAFIFIPFTAVADVQELQVSNNTSAAVNISWISDIKAAGEVHYSKSPDLSGHLTAYDVRGTAHNGCTHYVNIKNLEKNSIYYFEVVSGDIIDDNSGNYYTLRTMLEPSAPAGICLLWGALYGTDGTTPLQGALVYMNVTHGGVDSYPMSKLSDQNGKFLFNIKESRSTATENLFMSISSGDAVSVRAVACGGITASDDFAFDGCTRDVGKIIIGYSEPETTTSSTGGTVSVPVTGGGGSGGGSTAINPSIECTADANCDDGKFCNGPEKCINGKCVNGSDPCKDDEACYEAGDQCIPVGAPIPDQTCNGDSDCDNGLFCDGPEKCIDGECAPGASPCAVSDVCMEEMDTCWSSEKIRAQSMKKVLKRPVLRSRKCTWLILKADKGVKFDPDTSAITFTGPEKISSGVVVDTGRSVFMAKAFIFIPVCIDRDAATGSWMINIETSVIDGIKAFDEGVEAGFEIK